jgi:hypothetical protein
MMMMTVTKETEIPRMWIAGAFSVFASVMFYTLMIINIYYLSKERHTNKGCIVYHVRSQFLASSMAHCTASYTSSTITVGL